MLSGLVVDAKDTPVLDAEVIVFPVATADWIAVCRLECTSSLRFRTDPSFWGPRVARPLG